MAVRVRRLAPEELAAVERLTVEVYRDESFASEQYEPRLRDVASRAREATVLVAVDGTQLLGAVTVATRGGQWAEHYAPGAAVVRMLVVAPQARGRGIGEALVRGCLDEAKRDGCSLVRLSSQPEMTAAHRLYERLGFVRTPAGDWAPEPGVALLAYALPLVPWCDQCGQPLTADGHEPCHRAAELDPPRFCPQCRRRMVVQVTPSGWSARCVEHGIRTG